VSVHLSVRSEEVRSFTNETFDTNRFAEYLDGFQAPAAIPAIRDFAARLQQLNATRVRIVDRQDLSERIHNTVLRVVPQLETELNNLTIPLSSEKRLVYQLADELLAAATSSYRILLKEQSRRLFGLASSGRALIPVQRMMILLSRRIFLAYRVYAAAPKGSWHELHELYEFAVRRGLANRAINESSVSPAVLYKRTLLVAFSGPSRLASDDFEFVFELIDRHADCATFAKPSSALGEGSTFLIQPNRDQAGELVSKDRLDAIQATDLMFSVGNVAKALLGEGSTGKSLPADDRAMARDVKLRAIIEMLIRQWSTGPVRQRSRLKTQAEVGIAVGLDKVWAHLNRKNPIDAGGGRWNVTNESSRGFALMHVSGVIDAVRIGEIVGIFSPATPGCHICVVRWILSNHAEHVEIGLEELTAAARPAMVRTMNDRTLGEPALLFSDAHATPDNPIVLTGIKQHIDEACELSIGELNAKLTLRPGRVVQRLATTQLVQFNSVP
jgi:cyclic-di-GMP-binding protein